MNLLLPIIIFAVLFSLPPQVEAQDEGPFPLGQIILQSLIPHESEDIFEGLSQERAGKESVFVTQADLSYKAAIKQYEGFIAEGRELDQFCYMDSMLTYKSPFDLYQAKRSILATLQYLGLDITISAIASYARRQGFEEEEFKNLANNLVGSYCSQNLTVISHKHLTRNLIRRFSDERELSIPNIENNPYFSDLMRTMSNSSQQREKEFVVSLNLFKAFCSWGNDPENLRLLVPLVRDPVIMSYVFRHLEGKQLAWDYTDNKIELLDRNDTVRVACDGKICRNGTELEFFNLFPRSAGSLALKDDLNKVYCHEFRNADYQLRNQVPEIVKVIDETSLEEQRFLRTQFMALITKIPDLMIGLDQFKDAHALFRSGIDTTWTRWASSLVERQASANLFYEEPLLVEILDRHNYFQSWNPYFKVIFEVKLGEFDKALSIVDKSTLKFDFILDKSFLAWSRKEYGRAIFESNDELRENIVKRFMLRLEPVMSKLDRRLLVKPWRGEGPTRLIAVELLEQLVLYQGNYFKVDSNEKVKIPIEFHYGLFALRFLHTQKQFSKP